MKKLTTLLSLIILFTDCHAQPVRHNKDGLEIATVIDMANVIAVPASQRKHVGYDSIQLLVENGRISANFCDPNNWLYAKDTVYTGDTTYRLWSFGMQIDKDLFLVKRQHASFAMSHGNFDSRNGYMQLIDSVIIDDTVKVKIEKLHK